VAGGARRLIELVACIFDEEASLALPRCRERPARFDELASGNFARWRNLTTAQIEDAGQQEFLNWVCLAGAMDALDRTPEIVDYVESYLFNSDKCFALFHA
jgi:hypothetical protein